MKKLFALVFCAIIFAGAASAQNYNNAIGVRVGDGVGISYKHHLASGNALEFVGYYNFFYDGGFSLVGLYEWHTPVINSDFNLYYGAGANIWINDEFGLGIDGVVGLEYKIPGAPIALSLDCMPRVDLMPDVKFRVGFGLGIKYTF